MMNMKKNLIAFMVFVAGPVALSAAAPEGLTQAQLDRADAVYLELNDTYTLLEDGSTVHRVEKKVKLNTCYAFNRLLGETFIIYNPKFQQLTIHRAETTMADGTKVPSTPNAFNEVLPGACAGAGPFTFFKEMVVTHLGLELGCVIHMDYEIRTKPGFMPYLMGEQAFTEAHPVLRRSVTVKTPKDVKLNHRFLNLDGAAPEEGEEGAFRVYRWALTKIAPVPAEAASPAAGDYHPHLVFSTCPSWRDAAGHLNRRISAASWLDPECEKKAAEITAKTTDPLERMRAINRFVVNEVALVGLDPVHVGYGFTQAREVYHDACGTELDKGLLLVKMLRAAGFQAEPVLVSRHRAVAADVPSWLQFSEVRVITTVQYGTDRPLVLEEIPMLSPTRLVDRGCDTNLKGRTLFRPSLSAEQNILKRIPDEKAGAALAKAELSLTLDDKHHLGGPVTYEVTGVLNPFYALMAGAEGWAAGRVRRLLPGAGIGDTRTVVLGPERALFKSAVKTPVTLEMKHGLVQYVIPTVPGGAADMGIPVQGVSRTNPVRFDHPVTEEIRVDIALPDNLELVTLPPALERSNHAGTLLAGAWIEEGVLHIRRQLTLKPWIDPVDFLDLKELVTEWIAEDARRILFREKK